MNRLFGLALAAFCALCTWPPAVAAQTEISVIVYGGSFGEGWRKSVIEPFQKQHPDIRVRVVTSQSVQAASLMRTQKNDVKVDVFMMDEQFSVQTGAEGLYEPLTTEAVPNLGKLYPQFREKQDRYARFFYAPQTIVYNTKHIKEPPKSWSALWDPKYKGRVAISDIVTTPSLYLLMQMMDVTGSDGKPNVDGGFARMKELRPNILTFYSQMPQLAPLLHQGDVWIGIWPSSRAQAEIDSGAPIAWVIPEEGGYMNASTIGIAKGTKNLAAAQKYIDFVLSAEAQARNAEIIYLNPVNRDAKVADALSKKLGIEALPRLKVPDWGHVVKALPEWTSRWNREITSR
jgi:putative spermidine/putrescine transport system substrate-binding protein